MTDNNGDIFFDVSWDHEVYRVTIDTFLKELSFLIGQLRQEDNLFPPSILKKMLHQMREDTSLLELKSFDVLLSRLSHQVEAEGLQAVQSRGDAVNEIVKLAGSLESRLNEWVNSVSQQPGTAGTASSVGIASSVEKELSGLRILVAEDLKTSRIYLNKVLKMKGADVELSRDGGECIEKYYGNGPFDIIIMDIFMPGISGLEATRRLRENGETVPIVALTALASRDDLSECISAGCDDYITKPIDLDILVQTCCKHFKGKCSPINNAPFIKVLLITDNKTHQVFLTQVLQKRGAVVETAENSDTALHLFIKKQQEWSLVLIDQQLETIPWEEFIRLVFSIRSNLHILLMVDRGDIDTIQQAIKAGCQQVLPKPMKYTEIISIMDRWLKTIQDSEAINTGQLPGTSSSHEEISTRNDDECGQLAVFQRSFFEKGGDRTYCRRFNAHGRCGIILADVAGHDNKSALAASWLTGILEGMWKYNQDPEKLMQTLAAHYEPSMGSDFSSRFICLLALLFDPVRHRLYYANAGIPPAYLVDIRNPEQSRLLEWSGTPIGLFPGEEKFESGDIDFRQGNRIILVTDGLFESVSPDVTTQLYDYFLDKRPAEAIDKISDFILRSAAPEDDITIAVLTPSQPLVPVGGKRFSIYSDYQQIDRVMKSIDDLLTNYNGRLDQDMVSLAVREILLNAVEHGNKKNEASFVDIDVVPGGSTLTVMVSDEGPGFSYYQSKKQKYKEGPLSVQGMGLKAVAQIASGVETIGGSVKLTFELKDKMK